MFDAVLIEQNQFSKQERPTQSKIGNRKDDSPFFSADAQRKQSQLKLLKLQLSAPLSVHHS